ncbi:response regulator [Salipaludibacillus agaradhaerens]|jgi:two-component system chemotaxis response regulator CheY|uniref:Response regulator n=1 Tax=Salipaludibacillus agaradhaerens TaxID=76935 RepID=A0A9Q4G197_SALAG|nr:MULTISPECIES: response regulator [Salipaludibacillus]MCR6112419.1 response regulator [Bacillus sp. A301a_S52]UJW59337.1 response regulator [Bacillus sp. A116_S68]MCR6098629.1 response regulator [Salipaludibacillus agaradhaerens]MCR6108297.1 response regulator [Salipaludibacillus agaradhaerens]MCR6115636.1 response regulator [Salipaludibacillus agaradhaerens]
MAKLLITDDAAFMRMTLKKMVTDAGYEVIGEAENGKQAVDLYEEHRPDLVTMDITMPEMNGIEALEKIKSLDPNAKVVMCSAMGQQNMVVDAIQKGAIDFIVKPFDETRIKEALDKALAR